MLDIKKVKLRSEGEIIASWNHKETVIVSVVCTTFNHELYIEDAITGFLMQETDFAFEVIVHDDASTDNTANLILQYQEQYPNIIKPIFQTENQYSKGGFNPIAYANSFSKGEYIALCEGDDYWIDKNKLNKQVRVLDEFEGVDFCFHSAMVLNSLTKKCEAGGGYNDKSKLIDINEIITKKHGQIMTASTFVRRNVILKFEEFTDTRPWLSVGDIYIHFFGSLNGGAYYLNETMCTYRVFNPGSWTGNFLNNATQRVKHLKSRVKSYEELNEITENRYKEIFYKENRTRIKEFILDLKNSKADRIQLLCRYKKYYSKKQYFLLHSLLKFNFSIVFCRYIKKLIIRRTFST